MKKNAITVAVVIDEGFPLLSLSLITEPLRVANRESQSPLFRWRVLSPSGRPPRSSSGQQVTIHGGLDSEPADAVLLLASYSPARMVSDALKAWLRRRAASGAVMGCVDTGALIFAEAGLLDDHPAAVHHEAISGFREAYRNAMFADRLYDLEGNRCSSAGGVVTIDMTLALIRHFATTALSRRVAEILNYQPLDDSRADGAFGRDWSLPRLHRVLAKSVEIMQTNIDSPLSIEEIGDLVGWPVWRLRRLFRRHLSTTPKQYYLNLRLDHARNLLRNSSHPVSAISLMSGFAAAESLTRAYKTRFGRVPHRDRQL